MSSRLSEVTIGIPHNLVFAVMLGDPSDLASAERTGNFVLHCHLAPVTVNRIVRLVRFVDTPKAYFMDKCFYRGALSDRNRSWTIIPAYAALLDAIANKDPSASEETRKHVRAVSISLHFKRSRGATVNPLAPGHDIVFIFSIMKKETESTGDWFDITASNDPVKRSDAQRTPVRRETHLFIADPHNPSCSASCRACNNYYTRRLQTCSRCHVARYCDTSCQSKDWGKHKGEECAEFRALRQALDDKKDAMNAAKNAEEGRIALFAMDAVPRV